ncbi:unnamed protein product, partial [Laminaria digitata]
MQTQRLLLAFAAGGLMAEAALHLLPHLFLPPHVSRAHEGENHDSHHHDDHGNHHDDHGNHHDGHGGVDVYMLIAVGFLV